jgi:hypothetical protein
LSETTVQTWQIVLVFIIVFAVIFGNIVLIILSAKTVLKKPKVNTDTAIKNPIDTKKP